MSVEKILSKVNTERHEEAFINVFCGKSNANDAKLGSFADELRPYRYNGAQKEMRGVVVPARFARAIMPELDRLFHGKALPVTADTANGGNIIASEMQKQLFFYDTDDAAIFPRCMHAPVLAGTEAIWPSLDQQAAGDEDTPTEFAEYGLAACNWTAEGAAPQGTQPTFTQQKIQAFMLRALVETSQFLNHVSPLNIDAMLRAIFRMSLINKIDRAIINGNGAGQCKGILQTTGLPTLARAVGNQVSDDDLTSLEQSVSPMIRAQSVYIVADNAVTYLKKLKDSTGRPLYPDLRGARPMLRGYPVVATRITKLGSLGDVIFGWPGAYICALESDLSVQFSDDMKFSEGLRVCVAYMAVGGQLANPLAFATLAA